MKKMFVPVLLSLMMAFGACGGNDLPEGVMSRDQMVEFLSEAYLLEGFYAIETGNNPEAVSAEVRVEYEELLKQHGVTQDQFRKSMEYYTAHLDQYESIHDAVLVRLDEMAMD